MTVVANTAKEFLKAIASNDTTVSAGTLTTLDKSSYWERFMTIFQILKVGRYLLHLIDQCLSFFLRLHKLRLIRHVKI